MASIMSNWQVAEEKWGLCQMQGCEQQPPERQWLSHFRGTSKKAKAKFICDSCRAWVIAQCAQTEHDAQAAPVQAEEVKPIQVFVKTMQGKIVEMDVMPGYVIDIYEIEEREKNESKGKGKGSSRAGPY